MWTFSPWALLPPVYSVSTAAGLWVVYFVALHNEKIIPLGSQRRRGNGSVHNPYISAAGNFPPASCIFSEVMNLAAFVGFVIAVLRYLHLKHRVDRPWLNVGSLVAFSVGCFGMTLVGNFQVFTLTDIHNLGTNMAFGLGTLFCWVQSYITLRYEGRSTAIARFLLSGAITVCVILYSCLIILRLHMYATQWQWALVMLFLVFISTFAVEFRHSSFQIACTDTSRHPISQSEPAEVSRMQLDYL